MKKIIILGLFGLILSGCGNNETELQQNNESESKINVQMDDYENRINALEKKIVELEEKFFIEDDQDEMYMITEPTTVYISYVGNAENTSDIQIESVMNDFDSVSIETKSKNNVLDNVGEIGIKEDIMIISADSLSEVEGDYSFIILQNTELRQLSNGDYAFVSSYTYQPEESRLVLESLK